MESICIVDCIGGTQVDTASQSVLLREIVNEERGVILETRTWPSHARACVSTRPRAVKIAAQAALRLHRPVEVMLEIIILGVHGL